LNLRFLPTSVLGLLLVCAANVGARPFDVADPESVGMSAERLDRITEHFERLVEAGRSGGYQVLVARRGKVVYHENFGWADVEERKPVTYDTLFRIFSMTKPVTGVAMMMLYEEGHYSLSDPIAKHIPAFADLEVYAGLAEDGSMIFEPAKRPPTIHDLMQHTAGFSYGIFTDTPVDELYLDRQLLDYDSRLEQFIAKLADMPLLYQPGERWHYSIATDIQGYLIEQWSGMPFEQFLEERLFEPLGMDQTMTWVDGEDAELLAHIYTRDDGVLARSDDELGTLHYRAPGGFSGGAQLISTADDYWRFCQMLLNGGEFEGRRYLSPLTVDMMTTDRLPAGVEFGGPEAGFGLNVRVVTDPARGSYPVSPGEYDWDGLATTLFWIDPEQELIAIMLTQYLPWSAPEYDDLMHRLVRAAIIDDLPRKP